jgi:methylmalonyl-CoA/ethylmalonyl-CoA epimerase
MRLDHVALASLHAWDNVIRYCYQLGGEWLGGPGIEDGGGFYFCQVGFEGGTKLELLEPTAGEGSDFLRRFLDRNGPGPHHFTFKVTDFDGAIHAVSAAGYDVVGVDRSEPQWHEAFLHPKQSHGMVIQLAYRGPDPDDGEQLAGGVGRAAHDNDNGWPNDTHLPPPLRPVPRLALVEHLVADLESAVKLFAGPLEMTVISRTQTAADGPEAVLVSGPWHLRLVQPSVPEWQHWVGNRPGRLLRLGFEMVEPATVPGCRPLGDGSYELPPEANLGTRLLLRWPAER